MQSSGLMWSKDWRGSMGQGRKREAAECEESEPGWVRRASLLGGGPAQNIKMDKGEKKGTAEQ